MNDPTVSVCIPTYNHERFIVQTVESVLMQRTNFPIEILIGEDCSTDRTREIVVDLAAKHPDRIALRLAKRNRGAGRNFADLFAHCRGKYVIILEGDDYWTAPHKLQTQVDALEARPDWAMCFHPAETHYDDGRECAMYPEQNTKDEYTIYDLLEKDFMATGAVLFRNRLFGELPEWFNDVVVGDWVIHILNAVHGKIGFLPEPMSVYRVHTGGIFSSKSLDYKLVTIFKMLTKMDHHLAGRFTQEIDENRLRTVSWLVGQWENEQRAAKNSAAHAEHLASKLGQLEARRLLSGETTLSRSSESGVEHVQAGVAQVANHLAQLESKLALKEAEVATLSAQVGELTHECNQLTSEMAELRIFHERWNTAMLYRIYRETMRIFAGLRQYWLASQTCHGTRRLEASQGSRRNAA